MMIKMRERGDSASSPLPNATPLTCEEFQAQMPELMGGDIHSHEHLKSCTRCTALLAELEYIVEAVQELLPVHEPRADLWRNIEESLKKSAVEEPGAAHPIELPREA